MTQIKSVKRHKGLMLGMMLASSLALTACQGKMETLEAVPSSSPTDNFPIKVTQSEVSYHVNTQVAARKLDNNVNYDLANLARGYLSEGTGTLTVGIPSTGGTNARTAAAHVRTALMNQGVPASAIKTSSVKGMGASAPVKVSYSRLVAMSAPCSMENMDLVATVQNTPYPNFGCATQHNLAAMVSDPSRLVAPDPLGPVPSQRRISQFEKFNKGEEIELDAAAKSTTTATN